jgi:hypothetical protein
MSNNHEFLSLSLSVNGQPREGLMSSADVNAKILHTAKYPWPIQQRHDRCPGLLRAKIRHVPRSTRIEDKPTNTQQQRHTRDRSRHVTWFAGSLPSRSRR